jgi:hypothetical protein
MALENVFPGLSAAAPETVVAVVAVHLIAAERNAPRRWFGLGGEVPILNAKAVLLSARASAGTKDAARESGRTIFEPDLPGRKPKLRRTQCPRPEFLATLRRRAIAGQEQRNGFFDMSAHLFRLERLKARRDQLQDLVVGQNRPKKELGGKLGFGAAQLPAPSGAAEVAGYLAQNTRRTLRIEDAAQVRHAGCLGDHDPVERQRIGSGEEQQQIEPEAAEDLTRRAVHIQLAILSAGYSRRAPPDNLREQLLLVAKMPVESLLRRARPGSDELHGRLREPALQKYAFRDRRDFFAPLMAPCHAPPGLFSGTVP